MPRQITLLNFLWERRSLCATIFFLLVVGIFDENSFVHLYYQKQENAKLQAEITQYEQQYDAMMERQQQFRSSQQAVEEMARITLQMKSDDEDVYIVE